MLIRYLSFSADTKLYFFNTYFEKYKDEGANFLYFFNVNKSHTQIRINNKLIYLQA